MKPSKKIHPTPNFAVDQNQLYHGTARAFKGPTFLLTPHILHQQQLYNKLIHPDD